MPRRCRLVFQIQRDEQFWPISRQIVAQLRIVEIEQASAEPLCLAVNYTEYFGLLKLGQLLEAHKRKLYIEVGEMPEAVLAIHLRHKSVRPAFNLQNDISACAFDHPPAVVGVRAQVESERYSGT